MAEGKRYEKKVTSFEFVVKYEVRKLRGAKFEGDEEIFKAIRSIIDKGCNQMKGYAISLDGVNATISESMKVNISMSPW